MFGYWLIWVSFCAMGGFRFVSCVAACVSIYAVGGFWFVPCVVACVSICAMCGGLCFSLCGFCGFQFMSCVGFGLCSGWTSVFLGCVMGGGCG